MVHRWQKFAIITPAVIALITLGITFTIGWRPIIGAKKRALTDRKFETTPPVRNEMATTKIPFPLDRFIQAVPEPVTASVLAVDQLRPVARGAYLARMAACGDCHTPQEKGQPIPGMDFAGGFLLYEPKGPVASANITPAPSGIGYYNEATFVRALREGKVGARPLHASMPWYFYGKMTDDDLKSIFAYLQTVKPVKHQLDNAEPPTYCRLCKQRHGMGATN